MAKLAAALRADGHAVYAPATPSSSLPYHHILRHVAGALRARGLDGSEGSVAFVCHSLGGLIWRDLVHELPGIAGGRAVLLGSPLRGSIVARTLGDGPIIRLGLGPVMRDLAVERDDSASRYPGPFATVAGTRWTPLLPSAHVLRRTAGRAPSDSTVLVTEARSAHAVEHREVDAIHTFPPSNPHAIEFARGFLGACAPGSRERLRRQAPCPPSK